MSRSKLVQSFVLWASLVLCVLLYGRDDAAAATPGDQPGKLIVLTPQFAAEAVSFRAIDESGYDWPGSDEIYAVFADYLHPYVGTTETYRDVDTGDIGTFPPHVRCITPREACDVRGVSQILRFDVSFIEEDDDSWIPGIPQFCYGEAPFLYYTLRHGKCAGDDLIGLQAVMFTQQELLTALPRVGDSVERKLILGGPCGHQPNDVCGYGWPGPTGPEYEFTYRIRRLRDIGLPLEIKPD
jgi:hypothetical protein